MELPNIPAGLGVTRRGLLGGVASAAVTRLGMAADSTVPSAGRVKQSIAQWCFGNSPWKWSLDKTCQVAKELGCGSVELLLPAHLETLRPHGLTCAMVSIALKKGPGFAYGWNNPAHWPELEETTKVSIDAAAAFGAPNVIAFTGMKARSLEHPEEGEWSAEEGAANCVEGLKRVAGFAEKKGVTICLEMLNSRDGTGKMLGHPGYQGDHVEYCISILEKIGSPNVKLLFDLYHVQIMDGDLVRRIRQHIGSIGHVHTAGVPGRGELGEGQEIQYPAVIKALAEAGYQGFVGHEFIPTRDPYEGLKEAVALCRV